MKADTHFQKCSEQSSLYYLLIVTFIIKQGSRFNNPKKFSPQVHKYIDEFKML